MLNWLLTAGGLTLMGGAVLLLAYETIAILMNYGMKSLVGDPKVPTISSIVIPWVKDHKLWSSGIAAVIVGFIVFLILHWRIGQ